MNPFLSVVHKTSESFSMSVVLRMSVVLEPVETVGDVRDGILRFDEEAGSLPQIAKNLLVQTS
jgi:hypothetical protein